MICHKRLHNLTINIMSGLLLKFNHLNNNLFIHQVFNRPSSSYIGINLTCHSNHHSINHLSTTQHFHLNNNFLLARQIPLQPLPWPPSAYNPMSSMQYYRPTMHSQVSANQSDNNEIEGIDDDIPPSSRPTLPSE